MFSKIIVLALLGAVVVSAYPVESDSYDYELDVDPKTLPADVAALYKKYKDLKSEFNAKGNRSLEDYLEKINKVSSDQQAVEKLAIASAAELADLTDSYMPAIEAALEEYKKKAKEYKH